MIRITKFVLGALLVSTLYQPKATAQVCCSRPISKYIPVTFCTCLIAGFAFNVGTDGYIKNNITGAPIGAFSGGVAQFLTKRKTSFESFLLEAVAGYAVGALIAKATRDYAKRGWRWSARKVHDLSEWMDPSLKTPRRT